MHVHSHSVEIIEHRDIAVRVVGAALRKDPYRELGTDSRRHLYQPEELRFILSRRDGKSWSISETCLVGQRIDSESRLTEPFRSFDDLPDEYRAIVRGYMEPKD